MNPATETSACVAWRGRRRGALLPSALLLAAALAALSSCASSDGTETVAPTTTPTVLVAPVLTPRPLPTLAAPPSVVAPDAQPSILAPTVTARSEQDVSDLVDQALAIAAYAPFNQDGAEEMGPFFFGYDEATGQAGFACYQERLDELVDFAALRQEAALVAFSYLPLPANAELSARRAAADCISAEDYRRNWINAHVWGWNTYGRDRSTPELEPSDPCFEPVYSSPTEFVNAVVAGTLEQDRLAEGYIGPFPCADPVG